MIKKSISNYMNLTTEMGTYVPVSSSLAGNTFSITGKYHIKMIDYWIGAEIDNPRRPAPDIEFHVGMHFHMEGKRKDINRFCRDWGLP